MRRVATLVARAAPPQQVFAAVAAEVGRLLAADFAILVRYDPPDTLEVVGTWTSTGAPAPTPVGEPAAARRAERHHAGAPDGPAGPDRLRRRHLGRDRPGRHRDWGLRSSVGVPVSVEGQLWGAMVVAFTRAEPLPADTEARLAGFTELVATAIANAEAQAEVTASRARIVAAADQARRRIERDLHDGAQQRLVTLALKLRAAQARRRPNSAGNSTRPPPRPPARWTSCARPRAASTRRSWPTAASAPPSRRSPAAARSPSTCRSMSTERLPEPVEVSAYYVVAEALTNVAKHARASAVSVEAEAAGDVLRVTVRDDGAGGADLTRGTGLAGLKDRVEALGGRIFLDSPRGAGTSLRAELPLTAARMTASPPASPGPETARNNLARHASAGRNQDRDTTGPWQRHSTTERRAT